MSELQALEDKLLAEVGAAGDEPALEAVRVAALGKKGSISALLATLGKMSPEERKTNGAAINALKDQVAEALTAAARDQRIRALSIGELNPTRCAGDPETLARFVSSITRVLAATIR